MNNPWKVTAIAMALVLVTGLVTGVIISNWTGPHGLERRDHSADSVAKKEHDARKRDSLDLIERQHWFKVIRFFEF